MNVRSGDAGRAELRRFEWRLWAVRVGRPGADIHLHVGHCSTKTRLQPLIDAEATLTKCPAALNEAVIPRLAMLFRMIATNDYKWAFDMEHPICSRALLVELASVSRSYPKYDRRRLKHRTR